MGDLSVRCAGTEQRTEHEGRRSALLIVRDESHRLSLGELLSSIARFRFTGCFHRIRVGGGGSWCVAGAEGVFERLQGSLFQIDVSENRAATEVIHRDMYMLTSVDRGTTFRGADIARWDIGACVMSSASLIQSGKDVLAAWESEKQVYFGRIDHGTHKLGDIKAAPGSGANRKYPAIATNRNGDALFVWTENMAWGKGGSVAWQLYDPAVRPEPVRGETTGVPAWSLVATFARPDGNFTIIY